MICVETLVVDESAEKNLELLLARYTGDVTDSWSEVYAAVDSMEFQLPQKIAGEFTRVSAQSRTLWPYTVIGELCTMADMRGLVFLSEDTEFLADWEFTVEMESSSGFILDQPRIKKAIQAIDQLFAWSLENSKRIFSETMIKYSYYPDGGLSQCIKEAAPSSNPNENPFCEDGDNPIYLFHYLTSIRSVLATSEKYEKRIFHLANF